MPNYFRAIFHTETEAPHRIVEMLKGMEEAGEDLAFCAIVYAKSALVEIRGDDLGRLLAAVQSIERFCGAGSMQVVLDDGRAR